MNDFALILLNFAYSLLFLQQFEDFQILAATTGKRERRRVFGRKKMEIYERRVTSMKKLLAMVLALVMTLSLAVSANAFKDDKSISDDYAESVAVLNGMGVFKGYPDGTFKPSGKVTGYEVLAMILRAVGYDKNNEFSGADWALHVAQTAQQLGVLDNVAKTTDLNAPASRELVAELLFQGIQKAQVTYTPAFGYVTDKVIGTKANSLGEKNFKLASAAASDKWGRPATKWTYNTGDKSTLVVAKADASYTTKVDECDIAKDLGITSSKKIEAAYIDGKSTTVTDPTVTRCYRPQEHHLSGWRSGPSDRGL